MKKRLFFLGTSSFAADILEALLKKGFLFEWIITQPDKPAGRKKILQPSPVKLLAQKNNLPLKQFSSLEEEAEKFFQTQKPDLLLVAAYGKILPKKILAIPTLGAINVHASLLPKYRGASPIQAALLAGEKTTGITLILMNEKMDEGAVIAQESITIEPQDNYALLEKKLSQKASEILPKELKIWLEEGKKTYPQNEAAATYCKLIKKTDGKIDWGQAAEKIYNRFRAFSVWPGIFSFWQKNETCLLKIQIFPSAFAPDDSSSKHLPPGKVFLNEKKQLCIKAQLGFLIVDRLQLEGKKILKEKDFLLGQPTFLGTILS